MELQINVMLTFIVIYHSKVFWYHLLTYSVNLQPGVFNDFTLYLSLLLIYSLNNFDNGILKILFPEQFKLKLSFYIVVALDEVRSHLGLQRWG